MAQPIQPILIDLILVISFVKLVLYNITIAQNYFNYLYDPSLSLKMGLLYILIYAVLYIGIHPDKYYDILRIIYKTINVILKFISDQKSVYAYMFVINIIISIVILIILSTQKLTKNTMIIVGTLSCFQVLYKLLWGYKTINKRFQEKITYQERLDNINASDVFIHQIAEQDFNKLYELIKTIQKDIKLINKLNTAERQKYILQKLIKLDLTKTGLEDEIKKKFNLETNQLKQYITNLKTKIKKIEELQKNNNDLIKCVKKYV